MASALLNAGGCSSEEPVLIFTASDLQQLKADANLNCCAESVIAWENYCTDESGSHEVQEHGANSSCAIE